MNPSPSTPTISAGGPTTFCSGGSVTLTSSSATSNQWYAGGVLISGETNQTYSANATGNYTVVVTSGGCSAPSTVTSVTVNAPTTITGQPSNQTVCTGGTVSFTVTASGGGLTYQWFNGATQLNNGGNISGATTPTLTINPAGAGDASANYNCVVSGTCPPSPVTSNNASLTVNNITYGGNTSSGTTFTPCINMPSNPQTVSTTIDANQYFVMNVIQGLTYQVYTNALPAAGNALRLTVYEEGNPSSPVLASSVLNTGNPVSVNANDVFCILYINIIRTGKGINQQQNRLRFNQPA